MEKDPQNKPKSKSKSKSKKKEKPEKKPPEQRYLFSQKTDNRHKENRQRMGFMKKNDKKRI